MARTFRRDPYAPYKGKTCRDGRRTMASTPCWWIRLYMNKPKRRKNKKHCYQILNGHDPDNIAWALGNHKPHLYYW